MTKSTIGTTENNTAADQKGNVSNTPAVEYQISSLSPLRRVIAARMTEAKQSIPHYRVSMAIQMDSVIAQRKILNANNPKTRISVNDFIIKAVALALMEKPALNSQLVGNQLHQYAQADISIIVAVEGGLATPILRNVNSKSLQQIAEEVKALAAKAVAGKLKRQDIEGGTFSISNLGKYGVDQFDAIINPPQVAILAVGSAIPQPVAREGKVVIVSMMRASLSLDHRAIDGAVGAEFLGLLKAHLEHPEKLLSENSKELPNV